MEITLARALKYKNRLVGKISTVTSIASSKNSIIVGVEREVNVKELFDLRSKLVENLVALKVAISKANEPILPYIFKLSELKSYISVLRGIDTTHGKSNRTRSYIGVDVEPVVFESQIRFSAIEETISKSNKEIDIIQEKIDQHNHLTKIDVDVLDDIY